MWTRKSFKGGIKIDESYFGANVRKEKEVEERMVKQLYLEFINLMKEYILR